jgi:hypothetical protein
MGNANSNPLMNGYDMHESPKRPASVADLELNIRWQWDNNRGSVESCVAKCREGNQEGAIRALCFGQRHNGDVCNDYKTYRVEALTVVMRLYGGGGPVPGAAPPAAPQPAPFHCTMCGKHLGNCGGAPRGTRCLLYHCAVGKFFCPNPQCRTEFIEVTHIHP